MKYFSYQSLSRIQVTETHITNHREVQRQLLTTPTSSQGCHPPLDTSNHPNLLHQSGE